MLRCGNGLPATSAFHCGRGGVNLCAGASAGSSADLKLQASSAGRFYGARALGRRWDSAALESCDGVERHADRPRAGGEVD